MIVREALLLVVMGFGLGVAGALALACMLENQLFEVSHPIP